MLSNSRVVGIDPGLTGAIAMIYPRDKEVRKVVVAAPRLDAGKGMLDAAKIVNVFKILKPDVVIIERQQAMPFERKDKKGKMIRQGATSTFKTGYGFGLYMGILVGMGFSTVVVGSQRWQKVMYQGAAGKGKERSMFICGQLWPGLKLKKSENGKADALLMAEYGRRTISG